jgi:hypothetical protein
MSVTSVPFTAYLVTPAQQQPIVTSRCGRLPRPRAAAAVHVVVPSWCVAVSSSTPALWSPRTRIHRILIQTRALFRAEPGRSRGRSEVRIGILAWPNSFRM